MAENVFEPLFSGGNLVVKRQRELLAEFLIYLDAADHALEDRPEKGLLKGLDGLKAEFLDDRGADLADFSGANAVFAVVFPVVFFSLVLVHLNPQSSTPCGQASTGHSNHSRGLLDNPDFSSTRKTLSGA